MCEKLQVLYDLAENGKREEIYCRETYMFQTDMEEDAWWDICISHDSCARNISQKN